MKHRKWIEESNGSHIRTAFVEDPLIWREIRTIEQADSIMEMSEWMTLVDKGIITDADGFGWYASEDGISDGIVIPSDRGTDRFDPMQTHVSWHSNH